MQKTISREISMSGVGLHSGVVANLKLKPMPENSGICLIRTDVDIDKGKIDLSYKNVKNAHFGTNIYNEYGIYISTIEHLLSAINGLKIANIMIEIDGPEIPIMDGSSIHFAFAIQSASIFKQSLPVKKIQIIKDIELKENDGRYIKITPHDSLLIDFTMTGDVNNIIYRKNNFVFDSKLHSYIAEIANARTYCLYEQIDALKASGKALGGSLDNAIVVKDNAVLNQGGLRFEDEFIRHKILDVIGDIALCEYQINGAIYCNNSGHDMNNKLLHAIFADKENYIII
jgi:UDP-3-O-[3-hydroxymyristoyl] N-acetylglucosamine deacetylase